MTPGTPLQSLEARMLSAELRGDEQAWRELHARDDDAASSWCEIMPTALTLAAVRRFGRADLRLITVFVRAFRARHPHSVFTAADLEAVGVPPPNSPDAPVLPDVMLQRSRRRVPASLAGRFISAAMLRREQERRQWSALLIGGGTDDVTRLTRTAFTVVVRRQFRPEADLREISDLVLATRAAFHPDLQLMATEFIVRIALGEDVPEPDWSVRDEILARTLVLGAG